MAGNFIKDLPLFTNVQSSDELIVERVEGETRTTGRITYEDAIGKLILEPKISNITQSGDILTLTGDFEHYSEVSIDDVLSSTSTYQDDGTINVNIKTLDAGSHNFKVKHLYKISNNFNFTTS